MEDLDQFIMVLIIIIIITNNIFKGINNNDKVAIKE